ncbi:hypothetical protein [Methylobacterium gnaphalii]|uniref:Uncharacterized protein n=1 Tax=Methylobacterium gnaphalii TaxID=1010610 RepID=A0A512JHT0_9HYPH|nr:hypothetical protein [Methylobacterium gnaphalii]GEP09432.1 hypothetical protein MGN01_12770 [Methylobacterium gnaphalii]GJD68087.1 hypothetical protein MMMDOFMJ_1005 [Methylobacterium gnaphalii]GLS49179.1 hypothetical protein GCM10007885_20270 [Methylobacterium gnaphalii]
MSNFSLQLFCNRIVAAGTISQADVRILRDERLENGLEHRDEVDLLLALDRAVTNQDARFADLLVALIVDFAVWSETPHGRIDSEMAGWLVTSIAGRTGPTQTGARIAMNLVREAETSDEYMMAFALEANRWARRPAAVRSHSFALAA